MTAAYTTTTPKRVKRGPPRYAGDSLRPVTQVVRPLLKKILPQKSAIFQQIFDVWPEIVGGTDAFGTIPEKVVFPRNQQNWGILSLWAKSSGQAMELTYNKAMLLQRVNSVFGYAMLADIRVMAHPGLVALPNKAATGLPKGGMSHRAVDKMLTGVANPELKLLLSEFASVLPAETTLTPHNKGELHA